MWNCGTLLVSCCVFGGHLNHFPVPPTAASLHATLALGDNGLLVLDRIAKDVEMAELEIPKAAGLVEVSPAEPEGGAFPLSPLQSVPDDPSGFLIGAVVEEHDPHTDLVHGRVEHFFRAEKA